MDGTSLLSRPSWGITVEAKLSLHQRVSLTRSRSEVGELRSLRGERVAFPHSTEVC